MAIVRAIILCAIALMAAGFVSVSPVQAQTSFPSSYEAPQSVWRKMNPTTFQVSTISVLEQFDRVAQRDLRLTPVMRERLESQLKAEEGRVVMVPDGIVLDALTGRCGGKPCVYAGMRKQLGREDRALLFDLGDGVTMYWFTGEKGKSCNNIGIVFEKAPEPVPVEIPVPKKPPYKLEVQTKYSTNQHSLYLPAFMLAGCAPCCPPQYFSSLYIQNSSTDKSSTFIMVQSDQ